MIPRLIILALILPVTARANDRDRIAGAQAFFDQFSRLEWEYDPAVVDLYADTAVLRNTRILANGTTRPMTLRGADYKAILSAAMPLARERGDRSLYSGISFMSEGEAVRITAERYSLLKRYSSPISILISPMGNGTWRIIEEISQSRQGAAEPDTEQSASDCQTLIAAMLPLVEGNLIGNGEFHPFAAAITTTEKIVHVATDRPYTTTDEYVGHLRDALRANVRMGGYVCTAVCYDSLITLPGREEQQDAIAFTLDHRSGYSAMTVHPYRLGNGLLTTDDPLTAPVANTVFHQ